MSDTPNVDALAPEGVKRTYFVIFSSRYQYTQPRATRPGRYLFVCRCRLTFALLSAALSLSRPIKLKPRPKSTDIFSLILLFHICRSFPTKPDISRSLRPSLRNPQTCTQNRRCRFEESAASLPRIDYKFQLKTPNRQPFCQSVTTAPITYRDIVKKRPCGTVFSSQICSESFSKNPWAVKNCNTKLGPSAIRSPFSKDLVFPEGRNSPLRPVPFREDPSARW